MFLDDVPVNYSGVLLAAIAYLIIGYLWYSPFLFGNQWGRHEEKVETKESYWLQIGAYLGEFLIALIIAYVLALIIQISLANEVVEGITAALWVWIGFIATTHFSAVLWGRKTIKHFFIHACFMLFGFIVMGAILVTTSL